MNDKLKAFIASLAVVILCAVVAIITFSQGVWYGAIPLALGIFFLIRFTIPAWNEYQEIYGKSDSCKSLISRCETLIKEYSHSEGCVGEILPKIKRDAPKDIKIDDIEKQSRFFLMNYCANLLSTGQYHFYTDSLDPTMVFLREEKLFSKAATSTCSDQRMLIAKSSTAVRSSKLLSGSTTASPAR